MILPDGTRGYHCTPRSNLAGILRVGLRPSSAWSFPEGVYFFWRREDAECGRFPAEVVLELDLGGLDALDDPLAVLTSAFVAGPIGPERILVAQASSRRPLTEPSGQTSTS